MAVGGSGVDRRRRGRRDGRRFARGWSVLGVLALALPMVAVPATTASAATLGISKQVQGDGPFAPGEQVSFDITIACSDPVEACSGTVLTDALPDGLSLVGATIASGPAGGTIDADTDGDTVTAGWDTFPNGSQAVITVVVQVDPDLPYAADGVPITNTASVVADNAGEQTASDDVVPAVDLELDSDTTKSISPEGALAEPGATATISLGATNTSNDPVDTLVIQDPVDPTADPNPFEYLDYAGTGTITYPPNADTVVAEYWDGDSWEPLDDSVDPAAVQGVRYTFSGDIQPGATAGVPVEVVQNDAVEDLTDPTTVVNDVSSFVTHGDDGASDPTTDEDTYVITPPNNEVSGSKSFSPNPVSAGQPATVTIGAENTGTEVGSMTLTEPAPGTPSPFEGDDALTLTGFGPTGDGSGVTWPADATEATVTFTCADGTTPSDSTTTVGTLPNPPGGCVVVGFSVEFTGDIVTGGEATIPFTVDTDPDQTDPDVSHPNEIAVEVPNADGSADDTLVTLNDRLATGTGKVISPSRIPSVPGQNVIVQLPSQLLPFGPDGSTTNADQVVISDPSDPTDPGPFWDHFTAGSVRTTDVPAGSTLTVNYWDGSAWVPAPGCGPYTGPATVSCDLPDGAGGVQFVYDSTGDGFPPGTQFQPNFVAEFTGPDGWDAVLENCGASSASSDAVDPTPPAEGCSTVDPFPVDPDGGVNLVQKDFLGGDPASVLARSGDQVTARIGWSTGGFSGVDPVVLSDIADPEGTALADSFYDAFDLVRVEPISTAADPLIEYDQVESVELYVGGAWVPAAGDPCPCAGSFPGYTLTADEREQATSVRLTITESPDRTSSSLLAPQPGDGVARSTLADGRYVDLTFEVRDTKRSDGSPALGSTNGTLYNTGEPGLVNDTVEEVGTYDGQDYTDVGGDDVLIIDQPLNVAVSKDWDDGPISVPPLGTPLDAYPTTVARITGTNASNAKVDQLRLVEPGAPGQTGPQTADGTSPFDAFTLTGITITPPPGMAPDATTTVTVTYDDDSTATFDEAGAEALTAAELVDVVGVEVAFDGLVPPGASGSMDLELKLRVLDRYDNDPVSVGEYSPVPNGAVATIDDPGGTSGDVRNAYDDAEMVLQNPLLELRVDKEFVPDQIVEPSTGPVTMTLTGQPLGPSRTAEMVLVDDDPQFWNQYDFVGFDAAATLTAPIEQVQVDAYVGGTFTGAPGSATPVTVTGGAWVEGTPTDVFQLPAGVAPGDVQGLRFTFSRVDGSIWENPALPVQRVPITIERRDEMRSGGPVLPDLASNPPSPGESDPGVANNSVQGTATGVEQVDGGPVTGTDEAEADLLYVHATNGVEIVKDFDGIVTGGTQTPSATFPMSITVTNTGDRAIQDLVVSDPMPVDGDGPQLTLADVPDPYSFTLSGPDPDPADGTPLPTTVGGADGVTIDQTGNLEALEFSFPEGAALGVGQTYTITVLVRFRVGLSSQTTVENTAGVTGDRPWDECVTRLDDATGACEADADVRPTESAVISQNKLVKATEDDELDVILAPGADPDTVCTPDLDGFYAYPCTPVVPPGHDETWRVNIRNVGNDPVLKLVGYDRFPTPGDTGSYADTSRGSQFEPILRGDPPPQLVNAPAGTTARFSYTTVDDYCLDDIEDPLNDPVCPTDDPTTGWVPFTGDEPESLLSQVTAIKFVITFPDGEALEPGEFVALEAVSTTPPEVPDDGNLAYAFNSAAVNAVYQREDGDLRNLLPVEGPQVGIATAAGPLEVNKLVLGDGAAYAPDTMDLEVLCTSAVGSWVETELDPIPVTVTPGEPLVVPNLPYGAECTISEAAGNGQTDVVVIPSSVTIEQDPDVVDIFVANIYRLAGLELSKKVESDAVDADGNPIAYGPFEATVECTFLGDAVYADGYGPDAPMVVELQDGADPVELTGLPAGAECTITETGTAGAPSTSITVTQDDGGVVTTDGTSTTVVLEPDTQSTSRATNAAEITNAYDVGSLEVAKVVDGDGAGFGAGPFTLDVECTLDTGQGETVVYADTITLTGGESVTIDDLAAGASCTVIESDDGGATTVDVSPSPVTIVADETVTVTATNTFDLGAIEVSKVVDGDAAEFGVGPFEVTVECTFQGQPVTVDPASQTFVGGETVTFDGLPVGAECTVTETGTGGATSSTLTVDDGAPVDGTTVDVVVPPGTDGGGTVEVVATNTFDAGAVEATKTVDGDGAEFAQGPYELTLECTFEGEPIDVPGGATRTVTDGGTVTWDGLPIGAECTVTESDPGQATSVVIDPDTLVVGGADGTTDVVEVTVTNTYDLGSFTVEKVVEGDGAAFGTGPFEVSVACTFEGADVAVPGGATQILTPGGSVTYDGLPVGAECTVTETDDFGATDVEISTSIDGGAPGEVVVPADDADPVTITVTNTYDVGTIEVDKETSGLGAILYPVGPFEVTLACTFEGEPIEVPGGAVRVFDVGDPAVFGGLPVGAECVVTETDDFGATSTTVTVDDGEAQPGRSTTVTVPPTEDGEPTTVTVTFDNLFSTSPLLVRKVVDGDGAAYGTGPFEVTLRCTFRGEPIPIPGGPVREIDVTDGTGVAVYFGLEDGSVCTLSETGQGGATSVTIEPPAVLVRETGADADPLEIVVTNTFDLGALTVTKVVDGAGAAYGTGPFEVSVACTFEGEPVDVPGGAVRELQGGESVTYDGLPVGAECLVTETDAAGATSSTVSTTVDGGAPGEAVVPGVDADPAEVTVTNTFDLGAFDVTKTLTGGAAEFGAGPYEVDAVCTFQGEPVDVPGGAVRTFGPGETVTYDELPVGAECVVTETDAGGATSSTVSTTVDGGAPGEVVVPGTDADPAVVTVTNDYAAGAVQVTKEVGFVGAAYDTGTFEVSLACTFEGRDLDVPGGATRDVTAGQTVTWSPLPVGAECVVTETDTGGATATEVSAVDGGAPGAVVVAAGDPAQVTVTNMFPAVPPPLPRTGAFVLPLLGVALLLGAVGGLLVFVRRRLGTD
ncbi:hypothetical protein ATJ88_3389 [Isoptericola jiangsuensis]|uniref:DUF5979 domain-containing protein n=1 Tax=Isoptericola jiangsuensis TaxID=548579 RepID=A0A2A9F0X4_9MICO|nr:DUF5979 domain-containing protein [Isoptericola jiangsuensis]PFG44653.1 hypothetical protein ATJ88_3389 [Isoptericola jiangsuensis]